MRPPISSAALVILVASGVATGTLATLSLPGCGDSSHGNDGGAGSGGRPPPAPVAAITECRAPTRPSSATAVALKDAFPNLPAFSGPIGMAQAPGDPDHFYVWQQDGKLLRIAAADPTTADLVINLAATANKLVSGG